MVNQLIEKTQNPGRVLSKKRDTIIDARDGTIEKTLLAMLDEKPKKVRRLALLSGYSQRQVRAGIDRLRDRGFSVWRARMGYWKNDDCAPPDGVLRGQASRRWIREPAKK
jgi:hypothetical protein